MNSYTQFLKMEAIPEEQKLEICLKFLFPGQYGYLNIEKEAKKLEITAKTLKNRIINWSSTPDLLMKINRKKQEDAIVMPYFYKEKDDRSFHERVESLKRSIERNKTQTNEANL